MGITFPIGAFMILDFSDIFDGAIEGPAELQVHSASMAMAGDKPVMRVSYTILEAKPQGAKEADVTGEFVNHTVWLPSAADEPDKIRNKKKMLKAFLSVHGIDTSAELEINDVPAALVNNNVVVKATLEQDDWALQNRDELVTRVKRFYKAD